MNITMVRKSNIFPFYNGNYSWYTFVERLGVGLPPTPSIE
jgi:hypothetical protein